LIILSSDRLTFDLGYAILMLLSKEGGILFMSQYPESILKYTGSNIPDVLPDDIAKNTYRIAIRCMHETFGDNVEYEQTLRQILLCDATRDYLYGDAPAPVRYVPGTRPMLEQVVAETTAGCTTEREKVLALLCFVRDNYIDEEHFEQAFFGGTEEDLIRKHEWCCEQVSRLMIGLCEIVGCPGRIVFHIAAGHVTCEIFLEGKWAYFDPRCGLFYLWEDGRFMSVDEVVHNRHRIYEQEDWVYAYQNPYWGVDYRKHRNYHFCLSPLEMNCITPYSLMDADTYHFGWTPINKTTARVEALNRKYDEYGLMHLIR